MQYLNPDYCNTHRVKLEPNCFKCLLEYYRRLKLIQERATKLKREWRLAQNPGKAKLFEGL